MRIATSSMTDANVASMQAQQAGLVKVSAQISSGKSVSAPGDNAVAAAQAVRLQTAGDALSQYGTNRQAASSALQQEDSSLGSVATVLQQVNQLLVQAGNASLNNQDRAALATQLQADRDQLAGLANGTDATGNYVFGGFRSAGPPFTNAPNGNGANYVGDSGQRVAQIGPTRTIAIGDTGADVFTRAPTGAGSNVTSAAPGNSGTAVFSQLAVTQPGASDLADTFSVKFSVTAATPPVTTYTVQNTSAVPAQPAGAPQPYVSGATIALGNGQTLAITGAPANNDAFTVAPATGPLANVFTTLDAVTRTLKTPVTDVASQTALLNSLATYSTQVTNTFNNVLTVRASVGAREQEVTALGTQLQQVANNNTAQLSSLTSVDVVAAYSQFAQMQTALQAAQKAFVSVQGLSLFSLIHP